jgi:hypothetical protein
MAVQTRNESWLIGARYVVCAALGIIVFTAAPEVVRWAHGGAFAQLPAVSPTTTPPQIGNDNTVVNQPVPPNMGNGNTFVGSTDSNGNAIYNGGGTAIGNGACAGPTGVAIGAHAAGGGCAPKP